MQQVHAKRDMREEEALKESITKAVEENLQAESKAHVEKVLSSITDVGYESLYDFVDKLLNSCDQQISACVLRMLGQHGEDILNSIHARNQISPFNGWSMSQAKFLHKRGRNS